MSSGTGRGASNSGKSASIGEETRAAAVPHHRRLKRGAGARAISQKQFDDATDVVHKPAVASLLGGELAPSNHLTIELYTLKTIAGQELLTPLCETFDRVSITADDSERLVSELRYFDMLAETQAWHDDLWARLREDQRGSATRP